MTTDAMVRMLVDAEGENALDNTRGSLRAAIEQELERRRAREVRS